MTERGLRSVDSAPACPFVAFEDDREARSTSPDHRHRCYAELVPSPRAAAHQEAYCLSSAFPVCPTFQDWARREAAHARGEGDRPRAAPQAHPESPDEAAAAAAARVDGGPDEDEFEPGDRPARHPAPVADPPTRRNPPRDWAAPPPWASGGPGAGQTGSSRRPVADDSTNPPTFLAGRSDESRGLAGSAADRLVGGSSYAGGAGPSDDGGPPDTHDEELAGLVTGRRPVDRPEPEYLPPSRGSRRPTVSSTRNHQRERERERDAIVGPSWERARRYEAYPTIRSRAGLPPLPRLAVMAGALVIAAVALFFLPALLGVGGDDGDGSTSRPSASQGAPSASLPPTEPPEPTAQVYTIKENDTLSKVATDHGLTLDELLAANPEYQENPDRIDIGDEIIIPATPPSEFTDPSAEPSAEPS